MLEKALWKKKKEKALWIEGWNWNQTEVTEESKKDEVEKFCVDDWFTKSLK